MYLCNGTSGSSHEQCPQKTGSIVKGFVWAYIPGPTWTEWPAMGASWVGGEGGGSKWGCGGGGGYIYKCIGYIGNL